MTCDPQTEFGPDYYRTGNYTDYLERGPRYERMARELDWLFRSIGIADRHSRIIDYGCGAGFLTEALVNLGYSKTLGFDISESAKDECLKRLVVVPQELTVCDLTIALDVFEHMKDSDISKALLEMAPNALIARIPVALEQGRDFHLSISRRDPTHINCKTHPEWIGFLRMAGFRVVTRLDLCTIYTSPGVACLLALRS